MNKMNSKIVSAYADPPYLGVAKKLYGNLHPRAQDYDDPETHRNLIERMNDEFDCWALSLNEPSLRIILPMCPKEARTASWVKPFASFKPNVRNAWTWEPVIFSWHRARKRTKQQPTWRDHVSTPIAMKRGLIGAKPEKFCYWVFDGLNLVQDDDFTDLFPGTGSVTKSWEKWKVRTDARQFSLMSEE